MQPLPLEATHQAGGARIGERAGRRTVLAYRDAAGELRSALRGALLMDLSHHDWVAIAGDDRVTYLHGLATADVKRMSAGEVRPTAFLHAKGGLVALGRIWCQADLLLVETAPGQGQKLLEHLDRFLISEDAELADASDEAGMLGVFGPEAPGAVRDALGVTLDAALTVTAKRLPLEGTADASSSARDAGTPEAATRDAGIEAVRLEPRGTFAYGAPAVLLRAPASALGGLWSALLGAGAEAGGVETLDLLRVESGVPRLGAELEERTLPAEAGLYDSLSFDKGCYLGQEVVARLHYRGSLKRQLARLRLAGGGPGDDTGESAFVPGAELHLEGKKVGELRSAVRLPDGAYVGLGYVRRELVESNATVGLGGVEGARVEVVGAAGIGPPD